MAICSNCGAHSNRIRSRWNDLGQLPDQCPQCSPGTFEKFIDPSDKKIWMGYEAHPNEYEKRYDQEGVIHVRKQEYRAEQEARLALPATDEQEQQAKAEEEKRRHRRKEDMTPAEQLYALAKAREIAEWIEESALTGKDVC